MDTPAVELREVVKLLGGRAVLGGVNLRVGRGEFFSLLGPSGCGKTTSLRLVAGFEEPTSGQVLVDGHDVAGVPPYRRDVNLVFQSYALFPHLTVARNVAFGLEMRRLPPHQIGPRVAAALDLVRLAGFGDRRPDQLSGGQQQRVALARALVLEPSVLLLDEPLGALDLKLRKGMQAELKRIQRRVGTTFVYVTHDQEEALTMSDRLAVLDAGRVLQVGTPDEVYERPATRFVADFLGEANLLDGTVRSDGEAGAEVVVDAAVVRSTDRAAPGARVTLAVRPERIAFGNSGGALFENALPGVVEEAAFAGGERRYVVRLDGGPALSVRRATDGDERPARPGDRVLACFAPEAVRVLAPGAPAAGTAP